MRQRNKIKPFQVPDYIFSALSHLRPPQNMRVSEWAERYRVLDSRTSAMPGPWRNSVTPYLAGLMDLFTDYQCEEIIFVKPAQVGGTEALYNMLGYIIMQDPAPTIFVYPTDELAEYSSENRIMPMLRTCPALSRLAAARSPAPTSANYGICWPTSKASWPTKSAARIC